MIIFSNILKQTAKLFGSSILASVIFARLLNAITYSKPLVYMVLLLASLLLFLFICNRISFSLHNNTQSIYEYMITSIVPLILYIIAASILYHYRLSSIYIWFFLPTRFLEPVMRNNEKISFIVTYLVMFLIIIRVPVTQYFMLKNAEPDQALDETEQES